MSLLVSIWWSFFVFTQNVDTKYFNISLRKINSLVFCVLFEEKYFLLHLTLDPLPDCLYFMRHWATFILKFLVNQVVKSQISKLSLSFCLSRCFYMNKKAQQKVTYFQKEKNFLDKIKKIFSQFWMAFIETNKAIFFGRWSPKSDLKSSTLEVLLLVNIISCVNDATFDGLISFSLSQLLSGSI